jgi:hypothetical protein
MADSDIERDVGRLEGQLKAMGYQLDQYRAELAQVRRDLTHVVSILDRAGGSWKAMVGMGAFASAITATIIKIASVLGMLK